MSLFSLFSLRGDLAFVDARLEKEKLFHSQLYFRALSDFNDKKIRNARNKFDALKAQGIANNLEVDKFFIRDSMNSSIWFQASSKNSSQYIRLIGSPAASPCKAFISGTCLFGRSFGAIGIERGGSKKYRMFFYVR